MFDDKSQQICEGKNCFIVEQNAPFTDDGDSGIYFIYSKGSEKSNMVHVRYTDGPFYYRWSGDTLILRCPYWKVVSDNTKENNLFDFKNEFTPEEKLIYGYEFGTKQFYKNLLKDFKVINTVELK